MRRGQAFEVFRLLIAAVIAGAILMVLLSILGGLRITTQDPNGFISQTLKTMVNNGGGIKTSGSMVFNKDTVQVDLASIASQAGIPWQCIEVGNVGDMMNAQYDTTSGLITWTGSPVHGKITIRCVTNQNTSSSSGSSSSGTNPLDAWVKKQNATVTSPPSFSKCSFVCAILFQSGISP